MEKINQLENVIQKENTIQLGNILHGGDYNPEQWLNKPEILKEDIELLKQAHCNTVTLGVFSWFTLEPEEGRFEFTWLEDIINELYGNEIYVILATPSGARPKWLATHYPQVLRTTERREKMLFGGRHNHCFTSPIFRDKVRQIDLELSKRFNDHPAVLLWHISNEFSGECHCDYCQKAFQNWLQLKYETIEKLNEKWYTTVWSHTYSNFQQIESPSSLGESGLHGLILDWKRFVTDQTIDFIQNEKDAIQTYGKKKPITINMMYYFEGLNYFKIKDVIDITSWDSYPTWHQESEDITALDTGLYHDIIRSLKKAPFLLMESTPSHTSWQKLSKLKKPGMHELSSLSAVAHGADGILYFQWRQCIGGPEKFHGAVIDHYGKTDTRTFQNVSNLGKTLNKIKEIRTSKTQSQVAILYDIESKWAMDMAKGPRNIGLNYKQVLQKSYHAFRKMGLNVDFVDMEGDISSYKIVAAPMLYMFREGMQEKIRSFVGEGGQFILTYWSGVVDENDRCYQGGRPYGIMDILGLRCEEIDALYDWESNQLLPLPNNQLKITNTYTCKNLCELIKVTTATPLMVYGQDFYQNTPAFTVNQYKKGKAYYICCDAQEAFYTEIYQKIAEQAGITPIYLKPIAKGIEITQRATTQKIYTFIQNYNKEATAIQLPWPTSHILYGEYDGTIKSFGTIILEQANK